MIDVTYAGGVLVIRDAATGADITDRYQRYDIHIRCRASDRRMIAYACIPGTEYETMAAAEVATLDAGAMALVGRPLLVKPEPPPMRAEHRWCA